MSATKTKTEWMIYSLITGEPLAVYDSAEECRQYTDVCGPQVRITQRTIETTITEREVTL